MSICIACHGQPEGGGASVRLPACLSKDRKRLTHSGGANFLPVINLAVPAAACPPRTFPGLNLTLINTFTVNAFW